VVPGALEEPLAAIFRVLRRPRNPSTVAGFPAARGRGRLPHVCCSKQANKARGGKRSAGGSAGQEPGGREASAGQGARRRARRTRRYGGEVHGACGAMQAERRPYGGERPAE